MADVPDDTASIGDLLTALRAVAEPTRLRLLALCSRGELTVSELAQMQSELEVLEQSHHRCKTPMTRLAKLSRSDITPTM